ncbi:MAG: ChaN family lipoprotein [Bdellovibrionales bacterium]|nr:ChaN family lipoprotein [Bdellovibrionales bacterium]
MAIWAMCLLLLQSAWGLEYTNHIYDQLGQKTDLNHLISQVNEGDVVIVGEQHGFYPHHETQSNVIQSLQNLGFRVDVGMEHVPYTIQNELSAYISGQLSQDDFLNSLRWRPSQFATCLEYTEAKGYEDLFAVLPFDCYYHSLVLAENFGGSARAINLPRTITGKVSSQGIHSLSLEEQKLLPPNYEWGSDSYYQRFREVILSFGNSHGQISEETINNMFWSQSLWDETMSWKSLEYMQQNPNGVMVIIVGNFHAAYGDGLAARFKARGAQKVHIISQQIISGYTQDEINEMAQPDPHYGSAGDLVILTQID